MEARAAVPEARAVPVATKEAPTATRKASAAALVTIRHVDVHPVIIINYMKCRLILYTKREHSKASRSADFHLVDSNIIKILLKFQKYY